MSERNPLVLLPIQFLRWLRDKTDSPRDGDLRLPFLVTADANAVVGAKHEGLERHRKDHSEHGGWKRPVRDETQDRGARIEHLTSDEESHSHLERPAGLPFAIDGFKRSLGLFLGCR